METAVRRRETALGNFLADVVRERMKTDIAFVNSGSIRINDDILPSPIRNEHMEGIFYYDSTLISFRLTGSEILDILNQSLLDVDSGNGRFLKVSGIRFKYRAVGSLRNPSFEVKRKDVKSSQIGDWGIFLSSPNGNIL